MNRPKVHQRSWKNYLIDPSFQLRYASWLSGTGLLLVAAITSVFYFYIRENYAILVDLSPMTDDAKALLYDELNQIITKLALISFTFVMVITVIGIVISHRAAGAVYHFKKIFRKVTEGDATARIQLRPNDDFQEAAKEFNLMMETLKQSKTQ
jgi:methyl-accepting chemotaxis protein